MAKSNKGLDEDFKDVKMSKSEMRMVLDMLFQKDGFYKVITVEEWAEIQGGLAKHLLETINQD